MTQDQYYQVLSQFFLGAPRTSLESKVGPRLVGSDFRAVTPGTYIRIAPLLLLLVTNGCSSGCIQGTRFERALVNLFRQNPSLLEDETKQGSIEHDFYGPCDEPPMHDQVHRF